MRIDAIEIHAGTPQFEFEPIRQLEAKCEARTALHATPTIEQANNKLREMAASLGADAVIDVKYDSGISMTSWRSMKATGIAVRRLADDMPCPSCAETIKRAAKKCRFCGEDLSLRASSHVSSSEAESGRSATTQTAPRERPRSTRTAADVLRQEPLKSTDNPQTVIWIVLAVIVILALLSALGS